MKKLGLLCDKTTKVFLDMMALPDFSFGAMENWGLVTFREKYLLYDPKLYSTQQKMIVAKIVSHELAHKVTL